MIILSRYDYFIQICMVICEYSFKTVLVQLIFLTIIYHSSLFKIFTLLNTILYYSSLKSIVCASFLPYKLSNFSHRSPPSPPTRMKRLSQSHLITDSSQSPFDISADHYYPTSSVIGLSAPTVHFSPCRYRGSGSATGTFWPLGWRPSLTTSASPSLTKMELMTGLCPSSSSRRGTMEPTNARSVPILMGGCWISIWGKLGNTYCSVLCHWDWWNMSYISRERE